MNTEREKFEAWVQSEWLLPKDNPLGGDTYTEVPSGIEKWLYDDDAIQHAYGSLGKPPSPLATKNTKRRLSDMKIVCYLSASVSSISRSRLNSYKLKWLCCERLILK